ncbi:MAG TPA: hypothetical protein VN922_07480, partial [Bacteroidia bacterium]|nr:hypothetical protein [Bacteroidia bacterium]
IMAQDLSPFDANALADKLQGADPETVNGAIYQLSQKGYNVPQQVSALMNQSTQQSQVANATPQDGNSLNLFNYQSSGNDLLDAAKAFGEGAVNAIPSTIGVVGNVAKAAINVFNPNPQQNTAVNIGKLALGAVASVPGTFNQQMQNTLPQGVQDFLSDSKGTFNNMLQYYANRYGGYQNVLKSIANDPAGVALDLSVVLDGVGGALDAAKIGTAAQDSAIADAVSAGGEGVDYGNVAKAAGNVSMPGGIPETIGGQISKVGEAINPITLPFRAAGKLVGANAAAPGAVETAATNQGIEGSLTSGMKAGGMQRVLEGIASYLPASKQIIARINTAFDATTKAMTDFGSKMTDAFAGGNETPEEIIGNVSSKVQETANANLDLAKNMFGQFAAKNGEIEVDATKPFAPTSASAAIDGSGAISPAGVAQYVSDPNNAISYTSKINNFFKSVNKILNPQAEEAVTPESIAARELGMAGAKATPSLISQYIANNGDIIEKEMGEGGSTTPTVRTLYNISNGIDN